MDVNLLNPILGAFANVLPQIGFQSVEKKSVALVDSTLDSDGVLVNIAFVGQLKGVIIIGMTVDSAKQFASNMMMGMPVNELDAIAQSAISEMGNMVCANACIQFSSIGMPGIDISPPTMLIGHGGKIKLPVPKAIVVKFSIDGIEVSVFIGLQQ